MNNLCKVVCVALLAVPMGAIAASEKGCDSVNWGKEVLDKFPNAQKACHGVTMKNGNAYAHYVAEIVASDAESVTVNLIDKSDKAIAEIKFVPRAEQAITVGGKNTKYKDLKKGTRMDLYIQHNRWGLYSDPASTPMQVLSRRDL